MASWLRNVQEKLENVASSIDRVVQEAASEVTMNPEVEIEVEKQKCSEAERQLLIEQKKSDDLQKRVEELEEQLYSTNIENDAIKERFQQMISARDEQIKRYERELEHLRNWQPHDEDDGDDKLTRLKEENAKLRKEIAEWKKVARESSPGSSDTTKIKELQDEIRRLKEKHTEELADITYSNQQMIAEVRQEYESLVQKIKENHSPLPHLSHKSESAEPVADISSETLDETFKINEEFMRSMSVSLDEIKEENVQLTGQIQELEERIYNLMHRLEKQKTPIPQNAEIQTEFENTSSEKEVELNHEIERLKAINAEMAVAYNDLNSEFETHKAEHGTVMHANSDLVARIDALKASLIEYEERYELCKGEHMKTVSQLEKLTADFERLRSNFQITKRSSDQNEEKMSQEMLQLKEALEKTKTDRDNFRTEVKSFRDSVSSISSELDRLRDNNRKVMEDNVKLAESLSRHESVHEMLKESNEELARFRESLTALQQEHKEKINHLESEKAELEERILELEDQLNASTNWETTDASFSANTTQTEALSQSFTANTQTELEIFEPRQKEVLEEEISLLRQQIDFQNDEIERLRVIESENARQRPEEFESRLHSLQKLLDTREAQIEKLHKEINTREGQIERLQTEWISPEQRIELDDQIGSLRHQIAFLEEEINRLQRLGSENSNQIREDYEARLNSMQNLLTAREAQLEKLQTEWVSPEQRIELNEEISSLKHQTAFQEEEINLLKSVETENNLKIGELKEKINTLQEQLTTREAQLEKFQVEWLNPDQKLELEKEIATLKQRVVLQEENLTSLKELQEENLEKQNQEELEKRLNNLQNLLTERDVQLEKYKTMVESTLGSSTTEVVDLEASLHKGHKKLRNMSETESSNNGSQSGWDKIESEQFAEAAISESSGSETSISASKVFPDSCVEAQISPSQVSPTVSSTSTNEETHDEAKEAQITELKIKISDLEQQWNRLNEEAAEKEKNLKTSSFALLDIQHILQNLGAELDENLHKENETHESPDLLLLRQVGILQEQIEKIPRIMDEENKQKMDYYKQLEELNSVNEELISRLEKIQTELDAKNGVLAKATNEKETIGKELEFLRDHVKTMEEVTNREVLAFEEKEAELLEKIRVLDGKIQTDNQNFSQVQTQYQQQLSELQSKLAGFELENKHFHEESTHNENNRNEIENMKTNLSSLAQENYQLLQEVTRKDKTLETILTSLKNLQQLLHNLGASSIYEEEVLEENAEIDLVIERYLAGLHEQIEKLQKIVYDKHKESVEYYNKMQEFSSSYENQSKQLVSIQEQLAQSNTKLAMSYEEKEKAAKELGRLREHLLQMEDMSTKEAIAAEERETELRKRIRELEERSSAVSDTVVQSENFYQQQVSELSARLSTLEDEYMKLQERVLEKEKSLTDTSKSLSNLQLVLRDLGADHEKEIKQYDDDLDMLKEELNHLTKELEEFKTREAQLIENRRFHEDTVALLKEEIARKEKVIDELENQLEESNPVSSTQSVTSLASGATHGTTSTYKIDDVTLRSLFLSYLTADRDKQPEIAMVMSSILGYTQDEQGRIQKSLLSGDRSWFSFIRSSIHQPGTANANVASLTEQFVRFLEQESRVAHQHATLPVQSDSNTAIELNEPISSSETKPYDLKSILEDTEANEASA